MASEPSTISARTLAALVVVVTAVLLYSIVVAAAPLLGVAAAAPVVVLYFLWRFVRAHERIAAALEAQAPRPGDDSPDVE